ncbi:MAG TPA: hypothetical protein VFY28_00905 [Candidatus Paceibacterota bacterium]|nr:hypothetical protein [Candidatus Paceibacterota bacterium]
MAERPRITANGRENKVRIIHIHDETIGSIDWELPLTIACIIDALPRKLQSVVMENIEERLNLHVHNLLAVVCLQKFFPLGIGALEKHDLNLVNELTELMKGMERQPPPRP